VIMRVHQRIPDLYRGRPHAPRQRIAAA
jgi:hypothetical protein